MFDKSRSTLAIAAVGVLGIGVVGYLLLRGPDLSTPERAAASLVNALNKGSISTLKQIYGQDVFQVETEMCMKAQASREPDSLGGLASIAVWQWNGNKEHNCNELENEFRAFMAKLPKSAGLSINSVQKADKEFAAVYIEPPDYRSGGQTDEVVIRRQEDGRWLPSKVIRYRAVLRYARSWEETFDRRKN